MTIASVPPVSRAALLTAASRDAQDQSVAAIRHSLRLLRHRAYPGEQRTGQPSRPDTAAARPGQQGRDHADIPAQGHHRDRRIDG